MAHDVFEIDGRQLKVSNLDKVLYPETGFTKAEVIDYYARISPVLLDHLGDRGITMRRFPDGVAAGSFFEKRCPSHRPDWVETAPGPGDRGGSIEYCRLSSRPAVVWAANLAALELHAPMARADDIEAPQMVVFDLDPGEPATIIDCARVAMQIAPVLDGVGLECWPKTSGSKGMQVYVPLNTPGTTHDHASSFALAVAQVLEKQDPGRITSVMKKSLRTGKVFIDWSQNSRHKTTICVYSMRARPRPTVSTPLTWDEVDACAGGDVLSFEAPEVLDRVDEMGDLFAATITREQQLPNPKS